MSCGRMSYGAYTLCDSFAPPLAPKKPREESMSSKPIEKPRSNVSLSACAIAGRLPCGVELS